MSRRLVVMFGRKQSDAAVLRRLAAWRQGESPPGVRTFETGATPPLRFGSDDDVRYAPSVLAEIPDTTSKLDRLKADVMRDLDVFAKNPRRFLTLYFDYIAERLDSEREELERRLRPLGGLFRVEDWAFSALRPLPNATVFDAEDADNAPDAVPHDMAFWTGEEVLAIRLRGSAMPSQRETGGDDRLRSAGVRLVTISARDLSAGAEVFSDTRLPKAFRCFWRDELYPCSPYRPQGLPASLSLP